MKTRRVGERKHFSFTLAVAVAVASLFLTSCGQNTAKKATAEEEEYGLLPNGIGDDDGSYSSTTGTPPLTYEVSGYGNHPQHICVPASTKLWLRVIPHANTEPLMPYHYKNIKYPDYTYVYDGNPAFYNKLRVRLSIPNTSAAWDYLAYNDTASAIGNYSSYLSQSASQIVSQSSTNSMLSTPEYTNVWILGSDAYDGYCTYWEKQLGKCSTIHSSKLASNTATCGSGEKKIMITNIVSDYPCTFDKINWCAGGSIQTVTDYQAWHITIKAVTENTTTEGFL